MSLFTDALKNVEDGIDEAFAERCTITPMVHSEYLRGGPDTSLPTFSCDCIADLDGQVMGVTGTRYKAKIDANLSGYNAVISVRKSAVAVRPQKDWTVTLTERSPPIVFKIGDVREDGLTRLHLYGAVTYGDR